MSEITPTTANLTDPYVLQLFEALAKRDDRIAELEAIEHAARRLVEDGYCNDNNTQQALEAALENNDE